MTRSGTIKGYHAPRPTLESTYLLDSDTTQGVSRPTWPVARDKHPLMVKACIKRLWAKSNNWVCSSVVSSPQMHFPQTAPYKNNLLLKRAEEAKLATCCCCVYRKCLSKGLDRWVLVNDHLLCQYRRVGVRDSRGGFVTPCYKKSIERAAILCCINVRMLYTCYACLLSRLRTIETTNFWTGTINILISTVPVLSSGLITSIT